jgi:hypothetical protein
MSTILAITFKSTNYTEFRSWRRQQRILPDSHVRGLDVHFPGSLGGKVVVLHWESKTIIWEYDIETPMGLDIAKDHLYVSLGASGEIIYFDPYGAIKSRITHPKLCWPHGIALTSQGFLIACSGLDLVIELSEQGTVLFEWWAIDSGYDQTPLGTRRVIDRHADHRLLRYPTLRQTTHVNSVLLYNQDTIWATLFHQGQLISIDRNTKQVHVLKKNLHHPHSIHRFGPDRFIITESSMNRALVLDRDLNDICYVAVDDNCQWVQEAVLCTNEQVLIADANNHRILGYHWPTLKLEDSFSYSPDWQISQISEIADVSFKEKILSNHKDLS